MSWGTPDIGRAYTYGTDPDNFTLSGGVGVITDNDTDPAGKVWAQDDQIRDKSILIKIDMEHPTTVYNEFDFGFRGTSSKVRYRLGANLVTDRIDLYTNNTLRASYEWAGKNTSGYYWMRIVCHGTSYRVKFWDTDVSEPSTWHIEWSGGSEDYGRSYLEPLGDPWFDGNGKPWVHYVDSWTIYALGADQLTIDARLNPFFSMAARLIQAFSIDARSVPRFLVDATIVPLGGYIWADAIIKRTQYVNETFPSISEIWESAEIVASKTEYQALTIPAGTTALVVASVGPRGLTGHQPLQGLSLGGLDFTLIGSGVQGGSRSDIWELLDLSGRSNDTLTMTTGNTDTFLTVLALSGGIITRLDVQSGTNNKYVTLDTSGRPALGIGAYAIDNNYSPLGSHVPSGATSDLYVVHNNKRGQVTHVAEFSGGQYGYPSASTSLGATAAAYSAGSSLVVDAVFLRTSTGFFDLEAWFMPEHYFFAEAWIGDPVDQSSSLGNLQLGNTSLGE